jgi:hypothetical protein
MPPSRRSFLLRIDPPVLDAIQRWANDDLRSLNGQIEFLLRRALAHAGRAPKRVGQGNSENETVNSKSRGIRPEDERE